MESSVLRRRRFAVHGFFLILATGMLYFPVTDGVQQLVALTTYKPVPAMITDVGVATRQGKRGRLLFQPAVTYQFEVGDRSYRGSRLNFGPHWSDREKAEAATARYHLSERVTAYIHPRDPTHSFLKRDVYWVLYWGTLFLLLILGNLYRQALKRAPKAGTRSGDGA